MADEKVNKPDEKVEQPPIRFDNFQPVRPTRARTKKAEHGVPLKNLSFKLVETYTQCSTDFRYTLQLAPRRVLTKLSKGVHNQGYDNAEHDYICRVSDKINNPDGEVYEILERLGHGTFGQVLKCVRTGNGVEDKNPIALKIIKNKPAYFHQALVEVHILKMLNSKYDANDDRRIVRMLDFFVFRKHLCIAFELLSVNLYDVLKQNSFRGVSMALIRVLTEQLLKAMQCLREAYVIHCDLKPENVLLSNMQHTRIKLIDFGSACFENHTVYSYIQSRFYRSPEVMLGLPYTTAIDMWSLGCIVSELFLGLPIFPGHSEYDQVCRQVEVQGLPPAHMLDAGKNTRKYFRRVEEPLEPRPADSNDGDMASGSSGCDSADVPNLDPGAQELINRLLDGSGQKAEATQQRQPTTEQVEHPLSANGSPAAAAESATAQSSPGRQRAPQGSGDDSGAGDSATGDSATEGKKDDEPAEKGLSLMDLLRKKVGLPLEPEKGLEPGAGNKEFAVGADGKPPSSLGCESGSACGGESEGGSQVAGSTLGSNVSTAADAHEVLNKGLAHGVVPSSIQPNGEISDANVAGAANNAGATNMMTLGERFPASGSSDGGRGPTRRHRTLRRRVRTFWRLKSREEYERDEHKKEPIPKKYFDFKSLKQMVEQLPYKSNMSRRARAEEAERRMCFLQFLMGLLQVNPDERWTPLQAAMNPFITGAPFDPNFVPCDDEPVPSFVRMMDKGQTRSPTQSAAAGQVPRLAVGAVGGGQGAGFSGGGSARTWLENQQGGPMRSSDDDNGQPRSAPSTFRQDGPKATAAQSGEARDSTGGPPSTGTTEQKVPPPADDTQQRRKAMPGLWGHLCEGVPLPDDNPAESYRPPLDQLSEDYFRTMSERVALDNSLRRMQQAPGSPQKPQSSASSDGSTPTYGHRAHPQSQKGSPLTAGDKRSRAQQYPQPVQSGYPQRHQHTGTTATPTSTQGVSPAPAAVPTSVTPLSKSAPRNSGSQNGSRGSSPWHLPSPMSELSTASERVNSSQPSGSDSCGEHLVHSSGEDPSHSDGHLSRSQQPSDSDGTMTPQSHDTKGTNQAEEERNAGKDPREALWENIKKEMARVELSRDRLPRRLDITQSPGNAGHVGNFREKMGMNESGPVIPFGNTTGTGLSANGINFSPPYRSEQLGGSSSAHGHKRRLKKPSASGANQPGHDVTKGTPPSSGGAAPSSGGVGGGTPPTSGGPGSGTL